MITVARIQYTGAESSCLLVADVDAGTLTSSIGDLGSESGDANFGAAGVMDLSDLTVAEVVAAIAALDDYEAEVTAGDGTVSAEVVADSSSQAAGVNAYLLFEPTSTLSADALTTWERLYTSLTVHETLTDDDREYAEGLINAASSRANSITHRKLASRTYTEEKLDGTGSDMIRLPQFPVSAISDIRIDTAREFAADTALDADDGEYFIYSEDGMVLVPSGIPRVRMCVRVSYTAGLDPVPDDLQDAIIQAVVYSWKQRRSRALGTRSITADGVTTQYEIDIPMPAMRVIQSYGRLA